MSGFDALGAPYDKAEAPVIPGAPVMMRSALLYGDVNPNLMDEGAIWLQSTAKLLSRTGCAVTVVLKYPVSNEHRLSSLFALPDVTVRRPCDKGRIRAAAARGLSLEQASRTLTEVDAEHRYDLIVLRGWEVAARIATGGALSGRLWTCLTGMPPSAPRMTMASLTQIVRTSRYLLCPTENLRCFLEETVAEACGKCVLLPPTLAVRVSRRTAVPPLDNRRLRMVCTEESATQQNAGQMTRLPRLLSERGIDAQLHVLGGQNGRDTADLGVLWHGGQSRDAAVRRMAWCDIGLIWRQEQPDAGAETPAWLLEYGSARLPVVVFRTPMYEGLLGSDYPLFASSLREAVDAVESAARDPARYEAAAAAVAAATESFNRAHAERRFRSYLAQAFPPPLASRDHAVRGDVKSLPAALPLRVVVAGHDLGFFALLRENFERTPDIELRVQQSADFREHDPAVSESNACWAEVIICEWCGPQAVWYSRNKRPGSRLLIRLHRFEATTPYPRQVQISAVDQVICVGNHYARLCRELFGWPADKITVIPNAIDVAQFDRPKLDGADHHLGMIGVVPSRKRPDLALDVLEALRRDDDSYTLSIKSWLPWDQDWWKIPRERIYYTDLMRRIEGSPLLREAVVFDQPGPDVAAWLRRIGFVLSTSDDESFHVAVSEGMASRAIPVLRDWPDAGGIYGARWVHADPADMAASIAGLLGPDWRRAGEAAHKVVARSFSRERVQGLWRAVLTANPPLPVGPTAAGTANRDRWHA